MAIAGILIPGILLSVQTSTKILVLTNTQEIAKDIAISEMDYIRTLGYAEDYNDDLPDLPEKYSSFTPNVAVTYLRFNEQKIDISVSWNGKVMFTLTDYRTNY